MQLFIRCNGDSDWNNFRSRCSVLLEYNVVACKGPGKHVFDEYEKITSRRGSQISRKQALFSDGYRFETRSQGIKALASDISAGDCLEEGAV